MLKLSGVMLGSADPKVLGEFYTKIFGKPGWQQDDWYGFDIGGANLMVGPHSEVKGKNDMPGRIMFTLETAEVKEEFKRIKGLGAEVVAEPYNPSQADDESMLLATFADPDGNYFQLASPWKE
jgi:predicted enzyme related to lactoylglutathione lyase